MHTFKPIKSLHSILPQDFLPIIKNKLNLNLSESTLVKLAYFAEILEKWNHVYNLTGAKNAQEIFSQHIIDSLSIARYIRGQSVLDVGSGAGFPGIPLALALPKTKFTLLDSRCKKVRFLGQIVLELQLKNVQIVRERIEEFRGEYCFETIVTRATFSIGDMISKTRQLLCANGELLLMKGKYPKEELSQIDKAFGVKVHKLRAPGLNAERHLCIVQNSIAGNA